MALRHIPNREAELTYQRAVTLGEQALGPDHADFGETLLGYGRVLGKPFKLVKWPNGRVTRYSPHRSLNLICKRVFYPP
jgi:hypothetical protein